MHDYAIDRDCERSLYGNQQVRLYWYRWAIQPDLFFARLTMHEPAKTVADALLYVPNYGFC